LSCRHYTGRFPRKARRCFLALALPVAVSGCSLSMPMLGSDDEPATTGSVALPVEVQKPLPSTLAYSDAAKIGQAAAAAIAQAEGSASGEWVNLATGSSGTVERDFQTAAAAPGECRQFSTIVTSLGGVHRYAGKICQGANGRPVVQIADQSETRRS